MVNESDKLGGWIGRYGGPLTYWLRGRCSNPDDVVQETFRRLMQQKPLPERVGAWLFHVAANLAKEEVRRSRRREHREARVASSESVKAAGFARVEQDEVRELVEALPQQLREVVIARLWGELTWAEIAELLQTPQTSLYRRYEEALAALKEKLEPNQQRGGACPQNHSPANRDPNRSLNGSPKTGK